MFLDELKDDMGKCWKKCQLAGVLTPEPGNFTEIARGASDKSFRTKHDIKGKKKTTIVVVTKDS